MKEVKSYGPMVASSRTDWRGETIYYQQVEVRNQKGELIRSGERQVLSNGEVPAGPLHYSNAGIV